MPINEGLANLSHYAFVITVMAYALAVLAFACDFAFGRHAIGPLKAAKEPAADLVTVGSAPRAPIRGRPPGPAPARPRRPPPRPGLARGGTPGGWAAGSRWPSS